MGNIAVGTEYLPIIPDQCAYKVHRKVSDIVDDHYEPGVIAGYTDSGQV